MHAKMYMIFTRENCPRSSQVSKNKPCGGSLTQYATLHSSR